jgi:hypothetical protein
MNKRETVHHKYHRYQKKWLHMNTKGKYVYVVDLLQRYSSFFGTANDVNNVIIIR